MNDLPDDLLRLIFQKCSGATLACLECVSTRCRDIAQSTTLRVHITPRHVPTPDWLQARKDRVVTLSMRRVASILFTTTYPHLRVIDIMYATTRFWHAPDFRTVPNLRQLRVCTVSRRFGQSDVFKMSLLPDTLHDVVLSFDDSWRRVDVDASFPRMALRCRPCGLWFRQPDFHVTSLDRCREVYLKTHGCITTTVTTPHPIVKTVIESEDNFVARSVLGWFDSTLESCVIRMPNASFVLSQDMPHLDPVSLEIHGSLVAVDVLGSRLRTLTIRCRRLATIPIPPHITQTVRTNS
jgi:hypothetical protein